MEVLARIWLDLLDEEPTEQISVPVGDVGPARMDRLFLDFVARALGRC
jgi:hypothetical protein